VIQRSSSQELRLRADRTPTGAASETTAVRAIAVIPLRARNGLRRPKPRFRLPDLRLEFPWRQPAIFGARKRAVANIGLDEAKSEVRRYIARTKLTVATRERCLDR
jgi:hypothetical protein